RHRLQLMQLHQRRELHRGEVEVAHDAGEDRHVTLIGAAQPIADLVLQPIGIGRVGAGRALLRLHLCPSSPLISLALRPPARSCTRGPVPMARMLMISSALGASLMPTSMASKWLRT